MTKIYDYVCKKCWHMWRTKKKYTACPKCKSKELDIKEDILLSEE
jgi:Zn finger protein HypA/HybF involved in hydrogenase expression